MASVQALLSLLRPAGLFEFYPLPSIGFPETDFLFLIAAEPPPSSKFCYLHPCPVSALSPTSTSSAKIQSVIPLSRSRIDSDPSTNLMVHTEREMDRVLSIDGIQLIGINNRDLGTFEVDISNTKKLLEGERGQTIRQKGITVVGESGLFTPDDIAFVQNAGVHAVLVGESLIKQDDPGKGIVQLFGRDISS